MKKFNELKEIRPSGLPSYYDLMMSFMDVMDGIQDHDISGETGYATDSIQIKRIISTRSELRSIWINAIATGEES